MSLMEKENKQLRIELLSHQEEIEILSDENKQSKERIKELESFIKSLADANGHIVLINGYEYNIKKVIIDERYMVDDAGTLIDKQTRECYDIVEDVVDLLNKMDTNCNQLKNENEHLKQKNMYFLKIMFALKNYIENEDYERIEKVVDKIKKEVV